MSSHLKTFTQHLVLLSYISLAQSIYSKTCRRTQFQYTRLRTSFPSKHVYSTSPRQRSAMDRTTQRHHPYNTPGRSPVRTRQPSAERDESASPASCPATVFRPPKHQWQSRRPPPDNDASEREESPTASSASPSSPPLPSDPDEQPYCTCGELGRGCLDETGVEACQCFAPFLTGCNSRCRCTCNVSGPLPGRTPTNTPVTEGGGDQSGAADGQVRDAVNSQIDGAIDVLAHGVEDGGRADGRVGGGESDGEVDGI